MYQTVVVSNADSQYGVWTVRTLAPLSGQIYALVSPGRESEGTLFSQFDNVSTIAFRANEEDDWRKLCDRLEQSGDVIDALVHAAASEVGDSFEQAARANIVAPWLAAKYAVRLMTAESAGIVVLQSVHSETEGSDAGTFEAEVGALRIASASVLIDAAKAGLHLRLNRLLFDRGVSEQSFKANLAMLTDNRSSFMTGAEICLSPALSSSGGEMRPDLVGKTVLVTGATSGIGRQTAIEAGRLGAWVAVGGRKTHLAEETLAEIRKLGGDGMVVPLDVTREEDWASAVDSIMSARGALHGLVNNAGEARNIDIADLSAEDLNFLLEVNYRACHLGMTHVLDHMRQSGSGSIVNIASVAGLRGGPGGAAYGASKAAAIGLSRSTGEAVASQTPSIRINSLQPGFIWSESVVDALGAEGADKFKAMIEPKTPLGRVGHPEEIARTVAFLLSDAARDINAQAVTVSGGLELCFP
jgi:NAD(P)-dependent dehydrogenase (short-subunit alcohol dehydrogenase family)